jgi:hypothetical protein
MSQALRLVILLALVACGRDSAPDRERTKIGPLPMDTVMAALQDYDAKRISADSAAAIISSYMHRTGRTLNIEMDPELSAAVQRHDQRRRVP